MPPWTGSLIYMPMGAGCKFLLIIKLSMQIILPIIGYMYYHDEMMIVVSIIWLIGLKYTISGP